MTIDSLNIILFLFITIVISWILPKKFQMVGSILSTFIFLLYFDYLSLIILIIFSVITFFLAKKYSFTFNILFISIMIITFTFISFKLMNTINSDNYLIPIGLSFYSFRIIHYLFEGYKEKLINHSLYDFLAYLFFLPTLIVGPINRFNQFKKDLDERSLNKVRFSYSIERILYGYTKIIVLGNYLVSYKLDTYIHNIEHTNPYLFTYLSSVQYWLNLYFQFSGYADIAIGLSALMGFKIIENFNYPFLATNIADFWLRWHISLSSWIKDYVYAPLAAFTRKRFLSILFAMLVFGLWHQFSLTYILWGLYHALGITIWHKFQSIRKNYDIVEVVAKTKFFMIFSWLLTINFVMMSFEFRTFIINIFER